MAVFNPPSWRRIGELHRELVALRQEGERERAAFMQMKVAEGWTRFTFHSEYYGSHPEYGEGDRETEYLFHPEVDVSRWENAHFSHGHTAEGDENRAFREWLEALPEELYYEL